MRLAKRFWGLLKKEAHIQSRHRLNILNRLLIGPVISVLTIGFVYAGVFRADSALRLGEMTSSTYLIFVAIGFLVHTYLNSGYYFLSTKIMNEWTGHTLPLLWWAPCSRTMLIASMAGVEFLRNLIITSIVFLLLKITSGSTLIQFCTALIIYPTIFLLGVCLGLLRSGVFLINEGRAELIDHAYLLFVFSACLYFPLEMFPSWLHSIVNWNPAYVGTQIIRNHMIGVGTSPLSPFILLASVCFLSLIVTFLWKKFRFSIMERSFG